MLILKQNVLEINKTFCFIYTIVCRRTNMTELLVRYPHIRELREERNLNQAEVAAILNCSQVAYSYYEIGRRDIPSEILIKLADYYNCSTDYILGRTNTR